MVQQPIDAQAHFDFKKYIDEARWSSFYHQINEIIQNVPQSILEVGVGSGLLGLICKKLLHYNYESIDIDEKLNPDHIGSVLGMPFPNNQYDVVVCFQVLEHLPYENFEKALSELFRVAKKAVIISLPDAGEVYHLHIPKICRKRLIAAPLWRAKEHKLNGEHYWEINKKNYEKNKIHKKITEIADRCNYKLEKEYRIWENSYHHFFIFKREKND